MESSFICPHCTKVQDAVGVVSECTQELILGTDDWKNLEVRDTLYVYCLDCGKKLPTILKKLRKEGYFE